MNLRDFPKLIAVETLTISFQEISLRTVFSLHTIHLNLILQIQNILLAKCIFVKDSCFQSDLMSLYQMSRITKSNFHLWYKHKTTGFYQDRVLESRNLACKSVDCRCRHLWVSLWSRLPRILSSSLTPAAAASAGAARTRVGGGADHSRHCTVLPHFSDPI